ncbi:CubicO group peptidase (beta-lactamase class C family) [Natronoflexus pectinivorans]|uniref:CubicO group peptidase (Beta-lactamase class C family) n=2 Tax=Natronoflexus pectinivorans TaxID=682526 RepID=A0A4R2GKK5_9BACT|nr:CubicO group peptidase (beta-lactamase class C family) [Natronoflexus pectinivorans]
MRNIIITLVLIIFISCQNTKSKENNEYYDLITKIDSISVNNDFNGVILVTKNTTTIYSKAFGYSDLESKTPLNIENQFVIGSISKQITAVLVLREYEKGNLQLDDKIIQYLPNIKQPWSNEVTIHHLLVHTHGIVDLNKPLEFELGSQFHYSQLGFELLAQILDKVTGKTFNELSTELFTKYGMKNTYHPDNKNNKSLVKGYEESENGKLEYCLNSLYNYVPAGSFISNAEDLNKWNELLYSGKLVNEMTLALMETRYATRLHPIFDKIEYGYGLLFKDGENNSQIGAFGYAPGFVSACYHYTQTNMNLIVLENTARKLDNFKETFRVHTELMELIKKRTPNNVYTK